MNTLNLFSNNQKYHKFTTAERLAKETLGYTIITFRGNEYAVDFNSEESREKFQNYINHLTKESHQWFKEEKGNENWVLFNENYFYVDIDKELRFKNKTGTFETPINMSSCKYMFYECKLSPFFHFPEDFDTSNVVNMSSMFYRATFQSNITFPKSFNSKNLKYAYSMFYYCKANGYLHLSESFNCSDCIVMCKMFDHCNFLYGFRLSNNFLIRDDTNTAGMFYDSKLPTDFKLPESFNYLSSSKIKDMVWSDVKILPQQLQDLYYKKQQEETK